MSRSPTHRNLRKPVGVRTRHTVGVTRPRDGVRAFDHARHGDGLAARFAAPRRGPADGLGEAPALPVRGAPRGRPQRRTRDLDAEDFTGVSDGEIAKPLGQRWAPPRHRMVDVSRLLKGAPLGVREAHEDAMSTRMRQRGPSASDITFLIS